jgi:RNA polymerase sigma-70 factor (ECF subfamily)
MPIRPELERVADPLGDEEIVARVRGGDTAFFEVLMRRHNRSLYRAVRAVLRDDTEAEDVMQQAYLSAYAHLHQFAGQARFSTWLLRIGVNEALGRLRQRRRHLQPIEDQEQTEDRTTPGALEDRMPTPEDRAADHELAVLLEGIVDGLPATYREVFVLRLVEGLDTAETAAVLDLSQEAVKQRLHRAREMVQGSVEARMGSAAAGAFEFRAPRCDRVVAAVMARLPVR